MTGWELGSCKVPLNMTQLRGQPQETRAAPCLQLWGLQERGDSAPWHPGRRSPAGWWWKPGSCSSELSEGHPPPRRCHSRPSSSGRWGPRWEEAVCWGRGRLPQPPPCHGGDPPLQEEHKYPADCPKEPQCLSDPSQVLTAAWSSRLRGTKGCCAPLGRYPPSSWQPTPRSSARHLPTPLPDGVVDDDGIRVLQEPCQLHGDLREAHADTVKDLEGQSRVFSSRCQGLLLPSMKRARQEQGLPQPQLVHGKLTDAHQSMLFPTFTGGKGALLPARPQVSRAATAGQGHPRGMPRRGMD